MLHAFGHQSRSSRPVLSPDSAVSNYLLSAYLLNAVVCCVCASCIGPCAFGIGVVERLFVHLSGFGIGVIERLFVHFSGFGAVERPFVHPSGLIHGCVQVALKSTCVFLMMSLLQSMHAAFLSHATICVPQASSLELNRKARRQSWHRCGVSWAVCACTVSARPALQSCCQFV